MFGDTPPLSDSGSSVDYYAMAGELLGLSDSQSEQPASLFGLSDLEERDSEAIFTSTPVSATAATEDKKETLIKSARELFFTLFKARSNPEKLKDLAFNKDKMIAEFYEKNGLNQELFFDEFGFYLKDFFRACLNIIAKNKNNINANVLRDESRFNLDNNDLRGFRVDLMKQPKSGSSFLYDVINIFTGLMLTVADFNKKDGDYNKCEKISKVKFLFTVFGDEFNSLLEMNYKLVDDKERLRAGVEIPYLVFLIAVSKNFHNNMILLDKEQKYINDLRIKINNTETNFFDNVLFESQESFDLFFETFRGITHASYSSYSYYKNLVNSQNFHYTYNNKEYRCISALLLDIYIENKKEDSEDPSALDKEAFLKAMRIISDLGLSFFFPSNLWSKLLNAAGVKFAVTEEKKPLTTYKFENHLKKIKKEFISSNFKDLNVYPKIVRGFIDSELEKDNLKNFNDRSSPCIKRMGLAESTVGLTDATLPECLKHEVARALYNFRFQYLELLKPENFKDDDTLIRTSLLPCFLISPDKENFRLECMQMVREEWAHCHIFKELVPMKARLNDQGVNWEFLDEIFPDSGVKIVTEGDFSYIKLDANQLETLIGSNYSIIFLRREKNLGLAKDENDVSVMEVDEESPENLQRGSKRKQPEEPSSDEEPVAQSQDPEILTCPSSDQPHSSKPGQGQKSRRLDPLHPEWKPNVVDPSSESKPAPASDGELVPITAYTPLKDLPETLDLRGSLLSVMNKITTKDLVKKGEARLANVKVTAGLHLDYPVLSNLARASSFKISHMWNVGLKEYQIEEVRRVFDLYEKELGAIVGLDMGLGKTYVIAEIITQIIAREQKPGILVLVVPKSLVDQTAKKIQGCFLRAYQTAMASVYQKNPSAFLKDVNRAFENEKKDTQKVIALLSLLKSEHFSKVRINAANLTEVIDELIKELSSDNEDVQKIINELKELETSKPRNWRNVSFTGGIDDLGHLKRTPFSSTIPGEELKYWDERLKLIVNLCKLLMPVDDASIPYDSISVEQASQIIKLYENGIFEADSREKFTNKVAKLNSSNSTVIVTTFNAITSFKKDDCTLKNLPWKALLVDEAHRLDNDGSNCSKKFEALTRELPEKTLITLFTGTPVENSLNDIMTLLSISNPKLINKSVYNASLKSLMDSLKKNIISFVLEEDNLERRYKQRAILAFSQYTVLKEIVLNLVRYLKKEDPYIRECWGGRIPIKKQKKLVCKVHETASESIREIDNEFVSLEKGKRCILTAGGNIFKNLLHHSLKDSTLDSGINDQQVKTFIENLKSGVKQVLKESSLVYPVYKKIKKHLTKSEDLVLAVEYVHGVHVYEAMVQGFFKKDQVEIKSFHGSLKSQEKNRNLRWFNSKKKDSKVRVLIITYKAGGVGLDMPNAQALYFCSPPLWNEEAEKQVEDRVCRSGYTGKRKIVRMDFQNNGEALDSMRHRDLIKSTKSACVNWLFDQTGKQISELFSLFCAVVEGDISKELYNLSKDASGEQSFKEVYSQRIAKLQAILQEIKDGVGEGELYSAVDQATPPLLQEMKSTSVHSQCYPYLHVVATTLGSQDQESLSDEQNTFLDAFLTAPGISREIKLQPWISSDGTSTLGLPKNILKRVGCKLVVQIDRQENMSGSSSERTEEERPNLFEITQDDKSVANTLQRFKSAEYTVEGTNNIVFEQKYFEDETSALFFKRTEGSKAKIDDTLDCSRFFEDGKNHLFTLSRYVSGEKVIERRDTSWFAIHGSEAKKLTEIEEKALRGKATFIAFEKTVSIVDESVDHYLMLIEGNSKEKAIYAASLKESNEDLWKALEQKYSVLRNSSSFTTLRTHKQLSPNQMMNDLFDVETPEKQTVEIYEFVNLNSKNFLVRRSVENPGCTNIVRLRYSLRNGKDHFEFFHPKAN